MSVSTTAGTDTVPAQDRLTMRLLAAHIPLTLLLDLAETFGPLSAQILAGEPGSIAWLPDGAHA